MRNLIILCSAVLLIIISGCTDSGVIPPDPVNEGYTIHSTIVNWGGQSNIILKAELYDTNFANNLILATDTVSVTGQFGIGLKDISDTMYYTLRINSPCPNDVFITPGSKSSNNVRFNLYNDTGMIGTLRKQDSDSTGNSITSFAYINKSMSIIGNIYCIDDETYYHFIGVKGVNKVVVKTNTLPPPNHSVTNVEPLGAKWYVDFIMDEKNRLKGRDFE